MIYFRLVFLSIIFLFIQSPIHALTPQDVPIIPSKSNRIDKRKCEVAISMIFKNEADYLKEWLEYHLIIGVTHFYLYNNMSSDHYWQVLKPYVREGIVELFDVPFDSSLIFDGAKSHNFVQVCCYNHAIKLAEKKNKWLAIIDSDEFITLTKSNDLPQFLKKYNKVNGLAVYWQIYGTSNIWELGPNELMLEKLVQKFPKNYPENWLFKSIVRPSKALCHDPHWTESNPMVAPNHHGFSHTPAFTDLPVDEICINHYTFRTLSFYANVKSKRKSTWGYNPTPEQDQERMNLANSVYDPVMLKHMPELKKRVFGK